MGGDLVVRRARDDELDAVIELCAAALGWSRADPNRELFEWKHRENPFGASPIWVAEADDGRLAGVRVFLRWELTAPDGTVHRVVRAVDTATHPDFQGQGVFRRLTLGAIDELADEGVSFVFNTPNTQSRPGYLKMGWVDVGRLPVAMTLRSAAAPVSALRLARARVAADKWSESVGVGRLASESLGPDAHDELAELLDSVAGGGPGGWSTRRTPELYAWRYRFGPLHYRVLTLGQDLAEGFAVFRVRRRGTATECTVCDLVAPGDDPALRRRLAAKVRRATRAAGVDYLLRLGGPDARGGWVPLPGQGPRLTARAVTVDPPSDLADWDLCLGDVELFLMGDVAPVRVLWLIKGLGPGGAEQLLVAHARAHDADHFAYEAAYLVPWKHHLVPQLEAAGVDVTCWPSPRAWDLRWAWRLRRRLVDRDAPPVDVIHGHSPLVAAVTRLVVRTLSKARRPALAYTEHNEWGRHKPGTRWANRLTLRFEDHVIAVSDGVRSTMRTGRPVEVLHHGIDIAGVAAERTHRAEVRAELGIADDEIVVGIVANLRREKAYDQWLRAARHVLDVNPTGVRFVSVGQGPLEDELRALHADLGLGDRVLLLGYRSDATRVLSAFDVFSLASHHEGLPVALMEACAQGVPLVLTSVGGIPEVVTDGETGLLLPPGNAEALARRLLEVIDDPALRERLGAASAGLAERFGASAAVARLEELYATLSSEREHRPAHGR